MIISAITRIDLREVKFHAQSRKRPEIDSVPSMSDAEAAAPLESPARIRDKSATNCYKKRTAIFLPDKALRSIIFDTQPPDGSDKNQQRSQKIPSPFLARARGLANYELRTSMDRVELIQAALEALQPSAAAKVTSRDQDEARRIRGKLLGVLIRKWRLAAELSLAECANYLGAEPQLIEAWEYGESEPSLPQLELLSQFLYGRDSTSSGAHPADREAQGEYILLRQRLIGALLRAAREASDLPAEDLSGTVGLEAAQLTNFEFGEERITLSDLTALAQALRIDVNYFAALPQNLPIRSRSRSLPTAPADTGSNWREFAAESDNLPFIRLAMAFQHIARADLHRIADALFAIIRTKGDNNVRSGASP